MKLLRVIYFFLAFLLAAGPAFGQSATQKAERQIFQTTNRERQSHGLPALQWSDALATAAREHAAVMAKNKSLSHQFPGEASLPTRARKAGVKFISLSENVAQGSSAADISEQWIRSSAHHANVLDTDINASGVGVVEQMGVLYAVEDFAKVRP